VNEIVRFDESTPDPVADPSGYRQALLGLLGEDDPAEVQAATPAALAELLARAGDAMRMPPAKGEWSAVEVLGHFTDAELVTAARYRWILAHDRPEIAAYDQDLWATRLRHREEDPAELLALFEAIRHADLRLWERTPEEDRDRFGIHAERGEESFDLLFRMLAGHDRFHLNQLRRTLDAVAPA
jgi:hypothetical protein